MAYDEEIVRMNQCIYFFGLYASIWHDLMPGERPFGLFFGISNDDAQDS
jgi:hypothetical protein